MLTDVPVRLLQFTCGVCGNQTTVEEDSRQLHADGIPSMWGRQIHANGTVPIVLCKPCLTQYWDMVGTPVAELRRKLFFEFEKAMIARKKENE